MSERQLIAGLATKLGFGDKQAVILKTEELARVLKNKQCSMKISEPAKAVFCIDLAATHLGLVVDKDVAHTLSGLRKSAYNNHLNCVQKLLHIDKPLSVSDVCVQAGCSGITDSAHSFMKKYMDRGAAGDLQDFSHPQYPACAVYTVCKFARIKVDRQLFVILSRLKGSQWKELEGVFEKFYKEAVENREDDMDVDANNDVIVNEDDVDESDSSSEVEEETEPYEAWKKRIIAEAVKALRKD